MDISAAIIDQRLSALSEEIQEQAREELHITQAEKLKSLAWVYLTVKTVLDLPSDEAFDCLTEGGGDFGVDAIHRTPEQDGEFVVTLFQGKYKQDLEGKANFPEEGIKSLIHAMRYIFDPSSVLGHINPRLASKVEEVRSLIRDGSIPQVRAIACNNGERWSTAAEEEIKRANLGEQVGWEHINHQKLVMMLKSPKPVNDTLQLTGAVIVEDFNFSRVMLGKIAAVEIATLMERHGERLLERNIRRYLGMEGNRINTAIHNTLIGDDRSNFYFYNNGITLVCEKFSYNAMQRADYRVKVENLQIVNGGQTCTTIVKTVKENSLCDFQNVYILVRIYQLPIEKDDLVYRITFATNSQNPVDLKDLRANDDRQSRLEMDIAQLGYAYRRKRSDYSVKYLDITSGAAAEAILAVWRKKPHQAKFFLREHFGKLYDAIFTADLSGAQTIIAVLLYRIAENRRRRPAEGDPEFVRYASCFIAMEMGKFLLADLPGKVNDINHKSFAKARELVETRGNDYFVRGMATVQEALQALYGRRELSLQQLSATFRRGDLIEELDKLP